MKINKESILVCPVCALDYNHIVGTISNGMNGAFIGNKLFVSLMETTYEIEIERSELLHLFSHSAFSLLFQCEAGHYHISDLSRKQGKIQVNQNHLMKQIAFALTRELDFNKIANANVHSLSKFEILAIINAALNEDGFILMPEIKSDPNIN